MRKSGVRGVLYGLSGLCVVVGVLILVCGGLFAWVMRDGLGPESYTSHGREAWSRFFTVYFPMAYVGLFAVVYGLIAWLLGRFVRILPLAWVGLILLLVPSATCCMTAVSLISGASAGSGQPRVESVRHAVDQYAEVIGAIEAYRAEHGQYPPDLAVLVPDHLVAVPGVCIEGGEVVEYLPMPSFGEPFTFYVYGHNTERGLRQVWEEWELRYCRQDSCTYSSDHYLAHRIGDWIWVYRPESRPLLALPITWKAEPEPTPLPGWRYSTSEFFIDTSAFPEGWEVDFPGDITVDPTVNHVGREWGRPNESDTVLQSIWRAYTVADAEEKYDELLASQFQPSRPSPYDVFVPFEPPTEIDFQSQAADEFYLACGWWGTAYCEVIVRYHNYVTEMHLEREAEYERHVSDGLTYPEIEAVVRAMDARFAEVIETFYSVSSP